MKILGIETSCDETSVALVVNGKSILSNVVSSSIDLHKKTGGIVPEVAARKQVESIIPCLDECLKSASTRIEEVDCVAVTTGPGLIGSLIVGVTVAKTLSLILNKPLIPVNHLLAHIYANWLTNGLIGKGEKQNSIPQFPIVALIVSGGHTELILMKNHHNIKYLGGTRDDAAGESFDKIARILNLGYPGGPAIEREATKANNKGTEVCLPRPLINSKDFDFSFSGLKTATATAIRTEKYTTAEISYSFQETVCQILVKKTIKAALENKVPSVILAGGVSANKRLRELFLNEERLRDAAIKVHIPTISFCTDNAAAIASCAYYHRKSVPLEQVYPNSSLSLNKF